MLLALILSGLMSTAYACTPHELGARADDVLSSVDFNQVLQIIFEQSLKHSDVHDLMQYVSSPLFKGRVSAFEHSPFFNRVLATSKRYGFGLKEFTNKMNAVLNVPPLTRWVYHFDLEVLSPQGDNKLAQVESFPNSFSPVEKRTADTPTFGCKPSLTRYFKAQEARKRSVSPGIRELVRELKKAVPEKETMTLADTLARCNPETLKLLNKNNLMPYIKNRHPKLSDTEDERIVELLSSGGSYAEVEARLLSIYQKILDEPSVIGMAQDLRAKGLNLEEIVSLILEEITASLST